MWGYDYTFHVLKIKIKMYQAIWINYVIILWITHLISALLLLAPFQILFVSCSIFLPNDYTALTSAIFFNNSLIGNSFTLVFKTKRQNENRGTNSKANLSNGAPSVWNQRVWVDPGSWDAFSDASTLNCRNCCCKDQRKKLMQVNILSFNLSNSSILQSCKIYIPKYLHTIQLYSLVFLRCLWPQTMSKDQYQWKNLSNDFPGNRLCRFEYLINCPLTLERHIYSFRDPSAERLLVNIPQCCVPWTAKKISHNCQESFCSSDKTNAK